MVPDGLEVAGRVRIRPSESACGSPGTALMEESVQPNCAGNICLGPQRRLGDLVWWDGARIIHVGLYRVCWCEPHAGCKRRETDYTLEECCWHDSNFTQDEGTLEVSGPRWIEDDPVSGQAFTLELTGGPVTATSRIMLRPAVGPDAGECGGRLNDQDVNASAISAYGQGDEIGVWKVKLFRRARYRVCWCAGGGYSGTYGWADPLGRPCTSEYEFGAEIGQLLPQGPNTENLTVLQVIAGAPFSIQVRGDKLHVGDRLRVVSHDRRCGQDNTVNTAALQLYICGRGQSSCRMSSVAMGLPPKITHGPPPINIVDATTWKEHGLDAEAWAPVVVSTPGSYRFCWCQDTTWDPVRLVSADGYCNHPDSYAIEVGTLQVGGAYPKQRFNCTAFSTCGVLLGSSLPISEDDKVLIVPERDGALMACGRGATGLIMDVRALGQIAACLNNGTENCSSGNVTGALDMEPSRNPDGAGYIAQFYLEHVGQQGSFGICYCHRASAGFCNESVAFGQFAGRLYVRQGGRADSETYWSTSKYCDSAVTCEFSFHGLWATQVRAGDAFVAVPSIYGCGLQVAAAGTVPAAIFSLSALRRPPEPWEAFFRHPDPPEAVPYEVGDYTLCYCTSAAGDCTDRSNFRQAAGPLKIVGLKAKMSWSCTQGMPCDVSVIGWRLTADDKVAVVSWDNSCATRGTAPVVLADDFANKTTQAKDLATLPGMLTQAKFSLGRMTSNGRWGICLCSGLTSPDGPTSGGPCSDLSDFVQDAGSLTVEGSVTSVQMMPNQPPAGGVLSVVVRVADEGALTCAVSSQTMARAPFFNEVQDCRDRIPGCLGVASLPYPARKGSNLLHVPIDVTKLPPNSTTVHVWCVGDKKFCPNLQCAMPASGQGLTMQLAGGVDAWTDWLTERNQPFDLVLHGNPLNAQGGLFEVLPCSSKCGTSIGALSLGSYEKVVRDGVSITLKNFVLSAAGFSNVCWCDRTYGNDCVLWQHVGQIGVAGPTGSTGMPPYPTLGPRQRFQLDVSGVNLTSNNRLGVVRGRSDCQSNASLEAAAAAPVAAYGTAAYWELASPEEAGNFTVCWGPGDGRLMATVVARGESVSKEPCKLAQEWEPMKDSGGSVICSRPCRGGNATWVLRILRGPQGGGTACPPAEALQETRPCNTQSCPAAVVLWSWTEPKLVENSTDFDVWLQGFHFDPTEDSVALISADRTCGQPVEPRDDGDAEQEGVVFEVAPCEASKSSSTLLVCGSFSLDAPGMYRVCLCDASELNATAGQPEACGDPSTFALTPQNFSLIKVVCPACRSTSEGDAAAEDGADGHSAVGNRPVQDHFNAGFSTTLTASGVAVLLLLPVLAVMLACVKFVLWRRGKARLRWKVASARALPKSEHEEFVERVTREVWEAYSRTLAEHENPELFADEHEELDRFDADPYEENACCAEVQSTYSSLATSWSRTDTMASYDDCSSSAGSRPGTASRPGTGASLPRPGSKGSALGSATPPATAGSARNSLTPPATAGSIRGRTPPQSSHSFRSGTPAPATGRSAGSRRPISGLTPPRSARTARSGVSGRSARSHASLLRVELSQGAPLAPVQGGSFLDLPLMGKSVPPPCAVKPPSATRPGEACVKPIPISRPAAAKLTDASSGAPQLPAAAPTAADDVPAPPCGTPLRVPTPGLKPLTLPEVEPPPEAGGQAPAPLPPTSPPSAGMADDSAAQAHHALPHASSTARPPGGDVVGGEAPTSPVADEAAATAMPEPPARLSSPPQGAPRKPPERLLKTMPTMPSLPFKQGLSASGDAAPLAPADAHMSTGLVPAGLPAPPPPRPTTPRGAAELPPSSAPLPPPRPTKEAFASALEKPPPTPLLLPPPPPPMFRHEKEAKLSASHALEPAPLPPTPTAEVTAAPPWSQPELPEKPPGTPAKLQPSADFLQGIRDRLSAKGPISPASQDSSPAAGPAGGGLRAGLGASLKSGSPGSGLRAGVGSTLLGARGAGAADRPRAPAPEGVAGGGLLAAARASGARLQRPSALAKPPPLPAEEKPALAEVSEQPAKDETREDPAADLKIERCQEPSQKGQPAAPSAYTIIEQASEELDESLRELSASRGRPLALNDDTGGWAEEDGVSFDTSSVDAQYRQAAEVGDAQERLRAEWHARLTAGVQPDALQGQPRLARPGASLRAAAAAQGPRAKAAGAPQIEGHGFRKRRNAAGSEAETASNAPSEISLAPILGSAGPSVPGLGPRAAGQLPNWAFAAP